MDDATPQVIEDERTGRQTVRIAPLTNAQLVWGDEDVAMEPYREIRREEKWERGL